MLDDGLRPTTSEKLYEQASIVSKLIDVFRCHGAVELNITDLIPQAYERERERVGGTGWALETRGQHQPEGPPYILSVLRDPAIFSSHSSCLTRP